MFSFVVLDMIPSVEKMKNKFYPDDLKDGTLLFYNWLRQYIKNEFVVLNVGAGHTADRKVQSFKGEVKKVIGVDIDKAVLQNQDLDKSIVIKKNELPFENDHFDLAWADFVLEHVETPQVLLNEVRRVLKPGASFFFRTPNKYHYVSLISSITPHWFHELVVQRACGSLSKEHEIYPTFYKLNNKNAILKNAKLAGFKNMELRFIECDPSYMVFYPVAFLIGVLYERVVNKWDRLSFLRANIFGRLEK